MFLNQFCLIFFNPAFYFITLQHGKAVRDMTDILIFLIIGIFLSLLFLNIYFRVKVLKIYKVLVQNIIEFDLSHIMNSRRLNEEILPKYPNYTNEILGFIGHIRKSVTIAVILVILITVMGFILKKL